jgi:hypothetical protein
MKILYIKIHENRFRNTACYMRPDIHGEATEAEILFLRLRKKAPVTVKGGCVTRGSRHMCVRSLFALRNEMHWITVYTNRPQMS